MTPLEFTCTACRRPGIFSDCLASFTENLCGVDFLGSTLHLNVDPSPEWGDSAEMVKVAERVFGKVIASTPLLPSFPTAVVWCMRQPAGEFYFHLEDDWLVTEKVHLDDMLALLRADESLSLVNLRAYCHEDDRLCLAPGLWRSRHARLIADRLRLDANPERQLRPQNKNNPHGGAHAGFRGRQFPSKRVLRDMGRAWMAVNGLVRQGDRDFVAWAATKAARRSPQPAGEQAA